MTSITLEHTLYPPPVLPLSHNSYPYDFPQQNPDTNFFLFPEPTKRPPSTISVPVYTTLRPTNPPNVTQYPTYQPIITQRPTYPPFTTQRLMKKPTITTQRPITFSDEIDNNPFLRPPPVQQSYIYECGISNQPITNNINPLISKGMKTSPAQWPWLVALFLIKINFEFQCAGSILTQKHVITGMF